MKATQSADYKIKYRYRNIVAIEIDSVDEDVVIAAYGDGNFPSLILQNIQTKEIFTITFSEFEGFSIWSADLHADSLKICLVK